MKIHGKQLAQQLKSGSYPLYWVAGDETLLNQEAADSIRAWCRKEGFAERDIWHVDNSIAWDDVLLSANSLSLFAERKLMELRFTSAKPGDKALKALLGYLDNPNPDCIVLATSPKLDASAARTKTFKKLEAQMLWVQVWPVDAQHLPGWIGERLQAKNLSADREALAMLAERVEGNLLAAQQEVDKLALLIDGDRVDAQSVMRAVADSARYDVFGLAEQMLKGDARAVHRMLLGLRAEGTEASVVLWAVSRELRRLLNFREIQDKGQRIDSAMEKERIWKNQQGLYRQACQRLSMDQLREALTLARDVDGAIKGQSITQPWDGLSHVALLLAGRAVHTARRPLATHQ